jgi:hypothetical protein
MNLGTALLFLSVRRKLAIVACEEVRPIALDPNGYADPFSGPSTPASWPTVGGNHRQN